MPPHLIASPLAPLILVTPATSKHGRPPRGEDRIPSPDEWWRWAAPRKADATTTGREWTVNSQKRKPRTDLKMIGAWRVGEAIGHGSSGKVRMARNVTTQQFAAIKRVPKPAKGSKFSNVLEREVTVMKIVEHERIVKLIDVFETPKHLFLVTELCPGGELYHFIMENKLSPTLCRTFFAQLVSAVAHLHVLSIAHRDIKPENLLLVRDTDGALAIKLADLGMASFQQPGSLLDTSCGSPHYAAPEVISGLVYDGPAADIWSTGVVLFALTVGRLPFDDDSIPAMMRKIRIGTFTIPSSIDAAAKDLIRKMLVVKPEARINITDVAKHPYLKGVSLPHDDAFELPFPLGEDSVQSKPPQRRGELDKHILSNLQVLLKGRSQESTAEAVLKEDGPQLFYVILRNFRTRRTLVKGKEASEGGDAPAADTAKDASHPRRPHPALLRRQTAPEPDLSSQSELPPRPEGGPPTSPLPTLPNTSDQVPATPSPQSVPLDTSTTSPSALSPPAATSKTEPSTPQRGRDDSVAFPPLGPMAPRRASQSMPGPRFRPADGTPVGERRPKTFSMVKLKEFFSKHPTPPKDDPPPAPPRSPTPSPQFAVLRDAPLPPCTPNIALSTPTSPMPANPRTVKRSSGYKSLARAVIGFAPASPSPYSPPALDEGHLERKPSSIRFERSHKTSWLRPLRAAMTNENDLPANGSAASSPLPSPSASPEKRRPSPLSLVSSNRLPAVAARLPPLDLGLPLEGERTPPNAKPFSPRLGEPFDLLVVDPPTPADPSFLLPHSAPAPGRRASSHSLRGPLAKHQTTASIATQLDVENKLLRAALDLKDDELGALRLAKKRLSARVEKVVGLCEELENERDELAEKVRRMSFESSQGMDARWDALLRGTEEGRLGPV